MKQNNFFLPISKARLAAASVCAAALALSHATASTLIDLNRPVSESLNSIDGIYWNFDALRPPPNEKTIADSSSNGHVGYLDAVTTTNPLNPLPSLVGGVDREGANGFGSGLSLTREVGANANSRVYTNMAATNSLGMADTSFTGGVWLNLDSVQSGAQRVILMDKGGLGRLGGADQGGWGFYLDKDAAGHWLLGFQSNNGVALSSGYHSTEYEALNLQDGEWHHLAFNYEYRKGQENVVTFWLDGEAVGTALLNVDITSGSTNTTARRFSVGERATSSYQSRLDGRIDDLFVTTGIYGFHPIPEPGTYALLGVGLTLSLALRYRQRSQSRGGLRSDMDQLV